MLNSFMRIANFVSRSLVGLVAGFGLGYWCAVSGFSLSTFLASWGF